jgi:hypothetical protein
MTVISLIEKNYKSSDFLLLADHFLQKPKLLNELVQVATDKLSHPFPEYASWLLIHIEKKSPGILVPFQDKFIAYLLHAKNQTVLRNLMSCCQVLPLIDYEESAFLDKLLEFVADDSNKVALQMYAIYKLIQFTQSYPEIQTEIEAIFALKEENGKTKGNLKPAMRIAIRNYRQKTSTFH